MKSLPDVRIRSIDPPSHDVIFDLPRQHGLSVNDAAHLDLPLREN